MNGFSPLSPSIVLPILLGLAIGRYSDLISSYFKSTLLGPMSSSALAPTVLFDQVVLFGDSISQQAWTTDGLGAALANAYQRKLYVLTGIAWHSWSMSDRYSCPDAEML